MPIQGQNTPNPATQTWRDPSMPMEPANRTIHPNPRLEREYAESHHPRELNHRQQLRVQRTIFRRLQRTQECSQGAQFDIGFLGSAALRLLYETLPDADERILAQAHVDYLRTAGTLPET